ncbi:MAG: S-methyl-5'-thioinosine phosphorylase [Xanthomonadales bacterium]|nr:S-methyl-5'-thioinosine phosphorylase [Xanthomonadales bacterium]
MSDTIDIAVIGGTGLYRLAALESPEALSLETRYGAPSGPLRVGMLGGRRVAFLARHGESHSVAPHRINYRANVQALADAGVRCIVAVNAVGGITEAMGPRVLALPDQLIDYTHGRIASFCDEEGAEVVHVDFGEPYDASLRRKLLDAALTAEVALVDGGVYGCTQGPRLETSAEIERMRRDGCDLVGMTGMPEAALAREAGIPYASLCIVANWAAGCDPAIHQDAPHEITMQEVLDNVSAATARVPALLRELLSRLD